MDTHQHECVECGDWEECNDPGNGEVCTHPGAGWFGESFYCKECVDALDLF